MIHGREDLQLAQRIVIKAGTSIVSTPQGYPSLIRMANIVEHASKLAQQGKEVIIVTSGAVGVGRQRLKKQALLRQSLFDVIQQKDLTQSATNGITSIRDKATYNSACAAAGQLGLMSQYETMFNQFDIATSQVLLTAFDFTSPERRRNVQYVLSQLLSLGIVPLLNENDAVSANQGYQLFGNTFSDNDSLAALVSIEMNANLLILLTDVKGVYDRPPSDPNARLLDLYDYSVDVKIGDKSQQGRGGMGAKVDAASRAIDGGVQAVVIADGSQIGVIDDILDGKTVGTLFLSQKLSKESITSAQESVLSSEAQSVPSLSSSSLSETNTNTQMDAMTMAKLAREGSRQLQLLSSSDRSKILELIADTLLTRKDDILKVNTDEYKEAESKGLTLANLKRLKLTNEKILVLVDGLKAMAKSEEPIGKLLQQTELADGLILDKITTPIGVLLIIFESRPDSLPQIAALAIRSGNGLLLKGGKEAEKTSSLLHSIVTNAIVQVSIGKVSKSVIGLISRSDIPSLLKLDEYIDLIIPRGSSDLIRYVKENTRIPVLGHAEGICHVYVDKDCDVEKAIHIILDSKTDYPAACNSAETLLLHQELLENGNADKIVRSIRSQGVKVLGGPNATKYGLTDTSAESLHREYGDLTLTVELVSSVEDAATHIHTYGSGHTETIVTESLTTAQYFLSTVDSACVFHNASTRFADGYRFGLGAEVGISTGKIHARGPMGVEGLLTTKWILRSTSSQGHVVSRFSDGKDSYTHRKIV